MRVSQKLILLFLITMCFAIIPVYSGSNNVQVSINGKIIALDAPARIVEGRTLVPARGVCENLGYTVDWNAGTKTVTVKNDKLTIVMAVDSSLASVNMNQVALEVPAQIIENRLFIPLRFVSEQMKAQVIWSSATNTVVINTTTVAITPTPAVVKPKLNSFYTYLEDQNVKIRFPEGWRIKESSAYGPTLYDGIIIYSSPWGNIDKSRLEGQYGYGSPNKDYLIKVINTPTTMAYISRGLDSDVNSVIGMEYFDTRALHTSVMASMDIKHKTEYTDLIVESLLTLEPIRLTGNEEFVSLDFANLKIEYDPELETSVVTGTVTNNTGKDILTPVKITLQSESERYQVVSAHQYLNGGLKQGISANIHVPFEISKISLDEFKTKEVTVFKVEVMEF